MTVTRKPLLIVEDDPELQKQMRWAFDRYETVVASDRDSAIDSWDELSRGEDPTR